MPSYCTNCWVIGNRCHLGLKMESGRQPACWILLLRKYSELILATLLSHISLSNPLLGTSFPVVLRLSLGEKGAEEQSGRRWGRRERHRQYREQQDGGGRLPSRPHNAH